MIISRQKAELVRQQDERWREMGQKDEAKRSRIGSHPYLEALQKWGEKGEEERLSAYLEVEFYISS